jgi:hypothetical protein
MRETWLITGVFGPHSRSGNMETRLHFGTCRNLCVFVAESHDFREPFAFDLGFHAQAFYENSVQQALQG